MLHRIRALILKTRRPIRALIAKERLVLIRLVHDRHDREIALEIPTP